MKFILFLSLFIFVLRKCWTGAEGNETVTESYVKADNNYQVTNSNQEDIDNGRKGEVIHRVDSRQYERKYEYYKEQNYTSEGYIPDKAMKSHANTRYTSVSKENEDYKEKNHSVKEYIPDKTIALYTTSKYNTSLNKEIRGENLTKTTTKLHNFTTSHSSVMIQNSTYKQTEEKVVSDEKNSSCEDKFAQNINDTLQDEEFDWRAREDSYEITKPEQYPYSVMLVMGKGKEFVGSCTGSILTEEWILTASHCLVKMEYIYVYAGGNSIQECLDHLGPRHSPLPKTAQLVLSKNLMVHPHYREISADSDVGLIRMDEKLKMTKYVNIVQLTTKPWMDSFHSYTTCVITGFGIVQIHEQRLDDKRRKTHRLEVKSPCLCAFRLQVMFGTKIASRYICTKPKEDYGLCPGDSGGGLVCKGKVRGIAMQIIKMVDMDMCNMDVLGVLKCGDKNTISVFQDVCPFLPWINKNVKLFKKSEISDKCKYISESSRIGGFKLLLLLSFLILLQ